MESTLVSITLSTTLPALRGETAAVKWAAARARFAEVVPAAMAACRQAAEAAEAVSGQRVQVPYCGRVGYAHRQDRFVVDRGEDGRWFLDATIAGPVNLPLAEFRRITEEIRLAGESASLWVQPAE